MDNCKRCRFHRDMPGTEDVVECHRMPPNTLIGKNAENVSVPMGFFPPVMSVDWCGEFQLPLLVVAARAVERVIK